MVNCHNCSEFYIGMTPRRLKTRLAEHQKDNNSAKTMITDILHKLPVTQTFLILKACLRL